ncbi:MAG: hypothetical protein ACI8YB_001840 [Patiriisocius sp.]|jgi:hypothetical protein
MEFLKIGSIALDKLINKCLLWLVTNIGKYFAAIILRGRGGFCVRVIVTVPVGIH